MADSRAWVGIQNSGLLSTTALLDLFEVGGNERQAIEGTRRPEIVRIEHAIHGEAFVRDNKPLSEAKLASVLDPGVTVEDFLRFLNRHVFFWPTEQRLQTLLSARAYRDREHLILKVDTARLIERYDGMVLLSPINSGSTAYKAAPRGLDTFQPIGDYDFESRRLMRGPKAAIAEVAVDYAVPDILELTTTVHIQHPDGRVKLIQQE